ncbi:hypothetical protein EYF80_042865 [Liparis tanakae]|uniref:Uncharacterized protein n=1 Tax=Liparis tanakae TaxID=230148 RepID=A0A4Z2G099_9TELE|nr:hypothetical protein EYF80_042865 [Liparis tanakae]
MSGQSSSGSTMLMDFKAPRGRVRRVWPLGFGFSDPSRAFVASAPLCCSSSSSSYSGSEGRVSELLEREREVVSPWTLHNAPPPCLRRSGPDEDVWMVYAEGRLSSWSIFTIASSLVTFLSSPIIKCIGHVHQVCPLQGVVPVLRRERHQLLRERAAVTLHQVHQRRVGRRKLIGRPSERNAAGGGRAWEGGAAEENICAEGLLRDGAAQRRKALAAVDALVRQGAMERAAVVQRLAGWRLLSVLRRKLLGPGDDDEDWDEGEVAAEEDSSLGELWPECLALTEKRRGGAMRHE